MVYEGDSSNAKDPEAWQEKVNGNLSFLASRMRKEGNIEEIRRGNAGMNSKRENGRDDESR